MLARKLIILLMALLTYAPLCQAENFAKIEQDFQTVAGHIIMPIGEEYLIDLDASANLKEGDILALVPASKTAPLTGPKETSITTDSPEGFLRVTRIKSGYSYVKPVSNKLSPKKGDTIIRFDKVPARLNWTSPDEVTAQALKTALSQFDWLDTHAEQPALLTFTLGKSILTVTDPDNQILYQYDLGGAVPVALHKPETPPETTFDINEEPGYLNDIIHKLIQSGQPESSAMGSGSHQGQEISTAEWRSPYIKSKASGIIVADLDGDGQQEIAIATRHQLFIAEIEQGKYQKKTEIKIPYGLQLLSLDAVDLDGNKLPELYLTATSGGNLSSFGVEYRSGAYEVFANRTNWCLRAITLPGKGKVLLGQRLNAGGDNFIDQPFRVERKGERLTPAESVQVPAGVNLFAFVPFVDANNRLLYAYVNKGDHLTVSTAEGQELWQSNSYFGGTEIRIESDQNRENADTEPIYIPPRLVMDAKGEIIAVQNFGQRFLSRARAFGSGRLVALKWNGKDMEESWRTPIQDGYLTDFALADMDNDGQGDIAMFVQLSSGNIIQDAKSVIVSYKQSDQTKDQ